MSGDSFRFKEFLVTQRHSAMKVGTDGVITGSWADVSGLCRGQQGGAEQGRSRILDVGTGTGLIALMLAQRCSGALIDAVEICEGAAREAAANFKASPWANRMQVYNTDFQQFTTDCEAKNQLYDMVISNPPFFNGTCKSADMERTAARHFESLPPEDLLKGVVRVLSPTGTFVVVYPYSDAAVFIAKAALHGLYCHKMLQVFPKPGRGAKRMVLEFSRTTISAPQITSLMILDADNQYTEQYRTLTGDFYLRF